MSQSRTALLLVGSPKPGMSSSERLGEYVLQNLNSKGINTTTIKIIAALKSDDGVQSLIAAIEACDILILAVPLYVDSVPAPVIRAMELIAGARKGKSGLKAPLFMAIVNCGFPEAHQNHTAIAIYRRFAKEAGLSWAGGLALGGGGMINAKPLAGLGGMVGNVTKALDIASDALAGGVPVPEEAVTLMEMPVIPRWLYILGGNAGWIAQAYKSGSLMKLNARPYEKR